MSDQTPPVASSQQGRTVTADEARDRLLGIPIVTSKIIPQGMVLLCNEGDIVEGYFMEAVKLEELVSELRARIRELEEVARERDRLLAHMEFWATATVWPDEATILPAACSHMVRKDFVRLVQETARRAINRETNDG